MAKKAFIIKHCRLTLGFWSRFPLVGNYTNLLMSRLKKKKKQFYNLGAAPLFITHIWSFPIVLLTTRYQVWVLAVLGIGTEGVRQFREGQAPQNVFL